MQKLIYLGISFFLMFHQIRAQCWMSSYGRGAGSVISECKSDQVKDGALCYPPCSSGYRGVGPLCWEDCPSDFSDTGLFCQKWPHTYGKGCCCFFGRCCHNCNPGYTDFGCTCTRGGETRVKKSYGRGAGWPLGCKSGEELSGAVCYPPCRPGYKGIGPVCWADSCTGDYGYKCGALCVTDAGECETVNKAIVQASFNLGFDIVKKIASFGADPDWLGLFTKATTLTAVLVNDVCAYPNVKATACWKKIDDNKVALSSCSAKTSVDCGLFCASSKATCAKFIIRIISSVTIDNIKQSKGALAKYGLTELVNIVKNFNDFASNKNNADIKIFYDGFKELIKAISNGQTVDDC